MKYWVLRDRVPVEVDDIDEWATEFGNNRIIEQTHVGQVLVSTIFLGVDHRFGFGDGPPVLFETMTFGAAERQQVRYSSYDDAIAGHRAMVRRIEREEAGHAAEEGDQPQDDQREHQ